MATELQVEDKRGQEAKLKLTLTDDGFTLTQYGNEVIDATTLRKDGMIIIKTTRAKKVNSNESYTWYQVHDY